MCRSIEIKPRTPQLNLSEKENRQDAARYCTECSALLRKPDSNSMMKIVLAVNNIVEVDF